MTVHITIAINAHTDLIVMSGKKIVESEGTEVKTQIAKLVIDNKTLNMEIEALVKALEVAGYTVIKTNDDGYSEKEFIIASQG